MPITVPARAPYTAVYRLENWREIAKPPSTTAKQALANSDPGNSRRNPTCRPTENRYNAQMIAAMTATNVGTPTTTTNTTGTDFVRIAAPVEIDAAEPRL